MNYRGFSEGKKKQNMWALKRGYGYFHRHGNFSKDSQAIMLCVAMQAFHRLIYWVLVHVWMLVHVLTRFVYICVGVILLPCRTQCSHRHKGHNLGLWHPIWVAKATFLRKRTAKKAPTWTCCCFPAPLGGMRGASEWLKKGEEGGGRAEIKREAEQRQQPGAHAKKPRRQCFAARCCVVWPCVARQRDPSWRTIFHCHAANSEQKRTGKLRHSTTLPHSEGRTREEKKNIRDRDGEILCASSPNLEKREEGGNATWTLTALSDHISRSQAYVQDLVAQMTRRKLWKNGMEGCRC